MFLPILDLLLALLLFGSKKAEREGSRNVLIATLRDLDAGLSALLAAERERAVVSPILHNASSAIFCHVRMHRDARLDHLASQLELLLSALRLGKMSEVQARHLQAVVRRELALFS